MLSRLQRRFRQRKVGVVRGGDDHQIDIRVVQQIPRRTHYLHARPIGMDLFGVAAGDRLQRHTRRAADQRRMKRFAGVTEPHQPHPDRIAHLTASLMQLI